MQLKDYFNILWGRKFVIGLVVLITMLVVIVGTYVQPPIFQASTTLRIAVSAGGSLTYYDYAYTTELLNTYVEIANSRPILEELEGLLDTKDVFSVDTGLIPNTELIRITAEGENPKIASTAANKLAEILMSDNTQIYIGGSIRPQEILGEYLAQLQVDLEQTRKEYGRYIVATPAAMEKIEITSQLLQEKQRTYEILLQEYEQARFREEIRSNMVTIIEPAIMPLSPSKPNHILNYILGFIVSLLGGIGLAFVLQNLNPILYKTDEIVSIVDTPLLAKLPRINKKQLDISKHNDTLLPDSFRRVVKSIQLFDHEEARKALLIASIEQRQGKTMVASNLALSLAEHGESVIVVDCDMRSPKLHDLFGLSNETGLKEVLDKTVNITKAIQKSDNEGVSVLTSGSQSENPYKLFIAPEMKEMIESLKKLFDHVILDAPALSASADSIALSQNVDGAILVVRRAHARQKALQDFKNHTSQFSEKLVGLIVNDA